MTSVITSEFVAKCKEDFKKADLNRDGFLDFDEFKAMWADFKEQMEKQGKASN